MTGVYFGFVPSDKLLVRAVLSVFAVGATFVLFVLCFIGVLPP